MLSLLCSRWGAHILVASAFFGAVFSSRAQIVINEIHYAPDVKVDWVEFIELHNAGTNSVQIGGWRVTGGVDYTFPAGASIAAGGYTVVAADTNDFRIKFGFFPEGQWAGRLNNSGDRVELRNGAGELVDEVEYQLGFPWPTVGDAPGYSIELIHPSLDNSLGGSWRASTLGGTSSTPSTPSARSIFPVTQSWKFNQSQVDLGTAWIAPGYDDSTWPAGAGLLYVEEASVSPKSTPLTLGATTYYFRTRFNFTGDPTKTALELTPTLDDGAVFYLNGREIYRAGMGSDPITYATLATRSVGDAAAEGPYVLSVTNLLVGTNVMAVEVHQSGTTSSDIVFGLSLGALDTTVVVSTNAGPSPGRRNIVYATNAPPQIRQVDHTPEQPSAGQTVRITAKVTDPDRVTSVQLEYQVVEPGFYIELTNAVYRTNWVAVPMNDTGVSGDVQAGDDVYTAELPGALQVHRRLIRYRVVARDSLESEIRVPYADDPCPNFAYFVYSGVPEWRGAIRPGTDPVLTYQSNVMGRLATYHLISKRSSVEASTWTNTIAWNANDPLRGLYQWHGALVYDGKVYDHIRYRPRGGVWRYAMGKNMWKFDLNKGHDFEARDNYGRKLPVRWRKVALGSSIQQGDFNHRGEQGMFESVGFKMFNLAGVPAPETVFVTLRVIDDPQESYSANQYQGDFWGLYLAIEDTDGQYLDSHGLPDGNIYKMEGGTGLSGANGTLENQGPTGVTNSSDVIAFQQGINAAFNEEWWRANLNIPTYLSYQAVVQAIHHYDICYDKNFFFYLNPVDQKWTVLPWDLDLTWAHNMYDSGCGGIDDIARQFLGAVTQAGTGPQSGTANLALGTSRPAPLMTEFRNRVREVRDLMFNTDQAYRMIDEHAALLQGDPSNTNNILAADRAMWDYNPIMTSSYVNASKAGTGRFYQFPSESGTNTSLRGSFAAAVRIMKHYVGIRGSYLDSLSTEPTLSIPATPVVTSTAPSNYPLNRLTFRLSNYSGQAAFAAMQWRIAEITPTNFPLLALREPAKYEMTPTYQSEPLTAWSADLSVPSGLVRAGETYRVRARYQNTSGVWSHWSPPVEFVAGEPDTSGLMLAHLRVTELMFNSPMGSDYDFIELQNTSLTEALPLNGAKFTRGIDYTFGQVVLPPGGYLVLAKTTNVTAFRAFYQIAAEVLVLGGYSGNFSDGGEQVTLRTSAGGTDIVDFEYRDSRGWPIAADGSGHSMVVDDQTVQNQSAGSLTYAGSWRSSVNLRGSPGRAEPVATPGLVINEVVSHTDFLSELDSNDWIELYNASTNEFVFGAGWYLSDHPTNLTKWMIPAGLTVPARGWISFDEQTGFHNPTNIGFGINRDGETIYLSYLAGTAEDRVVDAVTLKAQENEWSWGRYPDGAPYWYPLHPRTRNEANAVPSPGLVISEIMYHPCDLNGTNDNTTEEFIEISNVSGAAMALFNTNGAWRLDGAVSFRFPTDLVLDAGASVVVVSFNPADAVQSAAFRARYQVPAGAVLVGPYSGKLGNNSERVSLELPIPPATPTNSVGWVIVDEVLYSDQGTFSATADGWGASLNRVEAGASGVNPANWRAAMPTPGAVNAGGAAPVITTEPEPFQQTVRAGEQIRYTVAASGLEPIAYQWLLGGNPVPGGTNATLEVAWTTPANSGEYRVLVMNHGGVALSTNVFLNVTAPPLITLQPQSQARRVGSNVTFSVTATGSGTVSYQWRFQDAELSGQTNSTLALTNVQTSQEGVYMVVVSDMNGTVFSQPAELTVLVPPTFIRQPQSVTVVAGQDAVFSVEVEGTRPMGYRWRLKGATYMNFPGSPVLTITNVLLSYNSNLVDCVVSNGAIASAGIRSDQVYLIVLADTDKDGMPDVWEIASGFSTNSAADALEDFDKDGQKNLDEYLAGTDPNDASSYLRIDRIWTEFETTGSVRLEFPARADRNYTVLYRDTIGIGDWQTLSTVQRASTNRVVRVTDQPPTFSEQRYYRLQIQ